jgi:hypothetical protein
MVYFSKSKTVVRVDIGIAENVPIEGANTLMEVNMKSKSIFSKKLNSKLVGEAEDEIVNLLTEYDYVVGAITYADSKSFYYYTKHKDSLFNMLNKVLSKYKKLKCEISIGEDPNWGFYLNSLYPDAFEIQRKLDREVVEQLKANNDVHQIPREINHWICFLEIKNREDFKRSLDSSFYYIVEEVTLQGSEYPYQLIISHTSTVEFETINKIITELLKKTIEVKGNYDGWQSLVIEK